MLFPPKVAPEFMRMLKPIWESDHPDHIKLRVMWGMLTGCQGAVLSQVLKGRIGNKVFAGPFRGMQLSEGMMKWNFSPTLLGTYEWELHEVIESVIANPPSTIVNVGCAYGYYSVGLAMRMPNTTIYAYDIEPEMQKQCRALAELNGVADRVVIGERLIGTDFERFPPEDTLVFMDIEGGEFELLDPDAFPALRRMNIIVELHDCIVKDVSKAIVPRFEKTHNIQIYPNTPFSFPLQKILGDEYVPDHFDNLIVTWESRGGPTPYGVFTRK